jgi:nicotinic acid phosphoribosyltransferase
MSTFAERYLQALLGSEGKPSPLLTDGYKFAMAQAGFPLREETFVLSLRKGGPFFIPFDLRTIVRGLLPRLPNAKEAAFLVANGYGLNPAMEQALQGTVRVWAAPMESWVGRGEPILTVTGPSFLVSWLEPLLIMLNFPIQIATAARSRVLNLPVFTCPDEAAIAAIAIEAADPMMMAISGCCLVPNSVRYQDLVQKNVHEVASALGGDCQRAFEVGMRAATCVQQHMMALQVCRAGGILKTSNVYAAWKLYMIPVGTTGHEHQQRWSEDKAGFRAIRDMRPEPPSYLFDTYNPIKLGIPAALEILRETPNRVCSLRFDSGDQDEQFRQILSGCRRLIGYKDRPEEERHLGGTFVDDLKPNLIFEDGYTAERTVINERFCDAWKWPRERRMYGYGGYLVSAPTESPYQRDAVSAAYKLSMTGGQPVMKFSGTPGKESIPGRPVILVSDENPKVRRCVAQEGEILGGMHPLTANDPPANGGLWPSPGTQVLIANLSHKVESRLSQAEV